MGTKGTINHGIGYQEFGNHVEIRINGTYVHDYEEQKLGWNRLTVISSEDACALLGCPHVAYPFLNKGFVILDQQCVHLQGATALKAAKEGSLMLYLHDGTFYLYQKQEEI